MGEADKWVPAVRRELARWGVQHASAAGSIAVLIAAALSEEREACAQIAEDNGELGVAASIRNRTNGR